MAIEMRLSGGLGNQLHQFAAGIAIAGELCTDLNLNLTTVNLGSNGNRRFELDSFEFGKVKPRVQLVGRTSNLRAITQKAFRRLPIDLTRLYLPNRANYEEEPSKSVTQARQIKDKDSVSGHFADFAWPDLAKKYGFEPRVRENLISETAFDLSAQIQDEDIAIHLRFGDFLSMPDLFPLVSDSYVSRCLSQIQPIGRIWVFTDDAVTSRKVCPRTTSLAYQILSPEKLSTLDTFWMLGRFKSLITSNSTFSSWAAYLSSKAIKVFTPKPHLLKNWTDNLPKHWIREKIQE